MKTKQIHKLNITCLLMLIEEFSSAVVYCLNRMVELEKCIKNVEIKNIELEGEFLEKEENIFSKIISRWSFEKISV